MDSIRVRPKKFFTFQVPQEMWEECMGITQFTIRELTAGDETLAAKRSQQEIMRLPFELAKSSIVEYEMENQGTVACSIADESIDIFLERMGPMGRNLVLDAYARTSSPGGGAISTFRAQQPRIELR